MQRQRVSLFNNRVQTGQFISSHDLEIDGEDSSRPVSVSLDQFFPNAVNTWTDFPELTPDALEAYVDQLFVDVRTRTHLYGFADASLFRKDHLSWNLSRLGTDLEWTHTHEMKHAYGINRPGILVGSASSCFSFHTEDRDLCSINYVHYGGPKLWIIIVPEDTLKYEALMRKEYGIECRNPFQHKDFLFRSRF